MRRNPLLSRGDEGKEEVRQGALRVHGIAVLRLLVPRRARPGRQRLAPPLPRLDVRRGSSVQLLQQRLERLVGGREAVEPLSGPVGNRLVERAGGRGPRLQQAQFAAVIGSGR